MSLQTPSDEELARQLAEGDDSALSALVRRYQRPLAFYIRRRCFSCQDEVEDILQDVFLQVFVHIREFDAGLSFSAWVYRFTHNAMVSRIRRHGVRAPTQNLDPELLPSDRFRADAPVEAHELARAVAAIESRMPDKLRDAFVLRFLEEKDYSEIGDILRENLNTVATRIRRAREFFMAEAAQMGLRLYLEDTDAGK